MHHKRWFNLLLVAVLLITLLPSNRQQAKAAGSVGLRFGWLVTYDSLSFDSLKANIANLDLFSPWYYKLNGSDQLLGGPVAEIDAFARSKGIKILPMVQNIVGNQGFHNMMAAPARRDAVIEQLYRLVIDNNYDGINLDFEALLPSDTALYTDFVTRIVNRLRPQGKLITADLAAKTRDPSQVAGAYDYAALGSILDYVAIMAYDFNYVGGSPGPIAPVGWVKQVADYTAARVPANKVLWGIDLYGLDWNKTTGAWADSRHYAEVQALKEQYGGQSGYAETYQSPWMTYSDDAGNRHEVWYENARSFQAKLNTIQPYGFAGIAMWRLGHEDPAIWPILAQGGGGGGGNGGPNGCNPITPFPNSENRLYFSQTGHTLTGAFLNYWRTNGGLAIFGYPLTEEHQEVSPTDGRTYTVQYFERNRFEYHPENAAPYNVLLGLLGTQALGNNFAPPHDPVPNTNDQRYFPETQHIVRGAFLNYWQQNGGLAIFGYPLTDEYLEVSPTDGRTYTVQYFERNRFEYHPENAPPYNVLLGLLGRDAVRSICPAQ